MRFSPVRRVHDLMNLSCRGLLDIISYATGKCIVGRLSRARLAPDERKKVSKVVVLTR